MNSTFFLLSTLIKVGAIIFFLLKILKSVFDTDGNLKKAVIQFATLFGILIGVTILEFGIAYLFFSAP